MPDLGALAEEMAGKLAKGLRYALGRLLELFDLPLTPELAGKLEEAAAHALHITIHELVHPLAQEAIPWLAQLPERERVLVEELLARVVERAISLELRDLLGERAVVVEDFEEQLGELRAYEQLSGLGLEADDLAALFSAFQSKARERGWARDFARRLLEFSRELLKEAGNRDDREAAFARR